MQWETVLTFRPIRFRESRFVSPFARARLHYCLGSSQSLSVQQPFSNQTTEKKTSMLRFGEARDAHGVTWRQFPFSFISRTNRWEDWISDCLIVTISHLHFSEARTSCKVQVDCAHLGYILSNVALADSKGFGSEQSDGHIVVVICRHWMMAMRGLPMWMSWPQNRIATKVVAQQMTLIDHYRSAIGVSAICLFG